jgi:hypothetical protein
VYSAIESWLAELPQTYRRIKAAPDQFYTFDDFITEIPMSQLIHWVEFGVSGRGLPKDRHLRDDSIAGCLLDVVHQGAIEADDEDPPAHLEKCIMSGWLHCVESMKYVFASPFHSRYVQGKLLGGQGRIKEDNPLQFALAVIGRFSPLNLTTDRNHGDNTQRPPEAQFQSEFYRASMSYTQGLVVSFPEFGNRNGKIDFYVPSKKWGIELLRDGNRIGSHARRFTEGEYKKWIDKELIVDYVILDFRTNIPREGHDSK